MAPASPPSARPDTRALFPPAVLGWSVPIVLLLATVIMFTALGGPRLWDRDEPRNAGCAAEMLAAHDWVTPTFNGELRSHKPVLLYWLMMPGYQAFGVNEFTARLPSALLAVGTCLLTWFIGARMFNRQVGLLSAMILCTTMMFVVAGRAATPDSVLIFFTTAATAVFVAWAFPRRASIEDTSASATAEREAESVSNHGSLPMRFAAPMYALMGCAVLAKGPVGMVLPIAVIGMFLLLERLPPRPATWSGWRLVGLTMARSFHPRHFLETCWWMRPITAVGIVLVIALPWYIWVGLRTDGAWLEGFFLEHNLGRAMRPMESHGGGPWYYPAAILAGFFPWSIFALPVSLAVWRRDPAAPDHRPMLFAVGWVLVYVGLFTIARTKLPSYVTPCYPALALLTGWQLCRWVEQPSKVTISPRYLQIAFGVLAVAGVGIMAGVPIAASRLLPGEQWLAVGGLIPIVMAVVGFWSVQRSNRVLMVRAMTSGAALLVLTIFALLSQHVSKHQQFDALLTAIQSKTAAPKIATYECMEPSWVFYAQQRIGRVWFENQHTKKELQLEQERPRWSPDPKRTDLRKFMADPNAFVITTQWQYDRIRDLLPEGTNIVARTPLFLKRTDLLVLQKPEFADRAKLAMKENRKFTQ